MGCGSPSLVLDDYNLQQTKILDLSICENNEIDLRRAQNLISLITKIRNRIIYLYHKLIYSSAACLYLKPSITHCIKNIFYKISCDFNGKFQLCNLNYIEDAPYLEINMSDLENESKEKLTELFDFIIELRSFKSLISQIDKDLPQLLYIEFEKNKNVSNKTIEKIHSSIELFDHLKKLRIKILRDYKQQIVLYLQKNDEYCQEINKIGLQAYNNNLTDIFDITFLNYKDEKGMRIEDKMFSNIDTAKSNWETIMNKDFDINLNNSINE